MKPSTETKEDDIVLKNVINGVDTIERNICSNCEDPNFRFDGNLSMQEYSISGLCQDCQDEVFGKE